MFTRNRTSFFPLIVAAVIAASTLLLADPPKDEKVIPWVRKTKGLETNRTGGNLTDRGFATPDIALFFIAPKSTGFTTADFPDIYWYLSQPCKQVTFTLVNGQSKKTEIRLVLKNVDSGFHKIDLPALAKEHDFKPLETNDWTPGGETAPNLKALYRIAIKSDEPKLLATAYIARVQSPNGQAAGDYVLQIKNELWYDAVQSLAGQLTTDSKNPTPRKQFTELLSAEEVLRSDVSPTANDELKRKARQEEETVFKRLSVPDPIDLKSDKWDAKFGQQSVPDPIDLK